MLKPRLYVTVPGPGTQDLVDAIGAPWLRLRANSDGGGAYVMKKPTREGSGIIVNDSLNW